MKRMIALTVCILALLCAYHMPYSVNTVRADTAMSHAWPQFCPHCYWAFDEEIDSCWSYIWWLYTNGWVESENMYLIYDNCELLVSSEQYVDWYEWCMDDCELPK